MMKLSPMMQQYKEIKEEHKEHILFFRLGDFYEMFFEDAVLCSKELDLTLTGKDCGQEERAPMCGVPHHSCEAYIARLVKRGYKVAICEQMEKPQKNKSIVDRKVIRIITPGTVIENNILDDDKNNYIASLYFRNDIISMAFCDISTGVINLTNTDVLQVESEISRFMPKEVLVDYNLATNSTLISFLKDKVNSVITMYDFTQKEQNEYEGIVNEHLKNSDADFTLEKDSIYINLLGGLISYLQYTQKIGVDRINQIKAYENDEFMNLSYNTKMNLELFESARNKEKKGSLFWVIDDTKTPMGKRLLRDFLNKPLISVKNVNERLDATQELFNNYEIRGNISGILKGVHDIERVLTRVVYKNVSPRELLLLKNSLNTIPEIRQKISECNSSLIKYIYDSIDELKDVRELIEHSITEEPPATTKDGGYIKDGFKKEIDDLRYIMKNGKTMLISLAEKTKEETGMRNLKVSYNKIFGYYFEVTKMNQYLVPENFIRRQTLANCERYVTDELKDLESQILNAKDEILQIERDVYDDILCKVSSHCNRIQMSANNIAYLDVVTSFANVAFKNNYTRPTITENNNIIIKEGRHPVVEILTNEIFVPNNTRVDNKENMVNIITGPNMAGKSTYMRQVAIITIMAQIGSFVSANSAEIGIVDKVFTRVGAYDDLSSGMSTFMVEMTEVAEILNYATSKSLIILDEIGRGTSTYDGMSIAMSVVEYIGKNIKAKTLFSTHYHELTDMEGTYNYIKNYNVLVKKKDDTINFLRRIVVGGACDSYGIDVANLAGVPKEVVKRAKDILKDLERNDINMNNSKIKQMSFLEENCDKIDRNKDVINKLKRIDVHALTPIEAMIKLSEIVDSIK